MNSCFISAVERYLYILPVINIDTYIAVIVGQLSIIGIWITYYQLAIGVAPSREKIYLGENITERFLKHHIPIYEKLVRGNKLVSLFILEILLMPLNALFDILMLDYRIVRAINGAWCVLVTYVFCLLVRWMIQCMKSTGVMVGKRDESVFRDINDCFLKDTQKRMRDREKEDLLQYRIDTLRYYIEQENNAEYRERYGKVLYRVFVDYYSNIKETYDKQLYMVQRHDYLYEIRMFAEALNSGKYQLSDVIFMDIFRMSLNIMKRKLVYIKENNNEWTYRKVIWDTSDTVWKLYSAGDFRYANKVVSTMYECYRSECDNVSYRAVYKEMLSSLLRTTFYQIDSCKEYITFEEAFRNILGDIYFNEILADLIYEKALYSNDAWFEDAAKQLSDRNALLTALHFLFYYSVYRFRITWEYMNIPLLRTLWERMGKQVQLVEWKEQFAEYAIKKQDLHRYTPEMFDYLCEEYEPVITGEWCNRVVNNELVDAFYLLVYKLCVWDVRKYHVFDMNVKTIDVLFKRFEQHEELLIEEMREALRGKHNELPMDRLNTLRYLLLCDFPIEHGEINEIKYNWLNSDAIGKFLLIKADLNNLSSNEKNILIDAYRYSRKRRGEYLELLYKECEICFYKLDGLRKGQMENYLKGLEMN